MNDRISLPLAVLVEGDRATLVENGTGRVLWQGIEGDSYGLRDAALEYRVLHGPYDPPQFAALRWERHTGADSMDRIAATLRRHRGDKAVPHGDHLWAALCLPNRRCITFIQGPASYLGWRPGWYEAMVHDGREMREIRGDAEDMQALIAEVAALPMLEEA